MDSNNRQQKQRSKRERTEPGPDMFNEFDNMAKGLKDVIETMKPGMEKMKQMAMKGNEKIQPKEQRTITVHGKEASLILSITGDIFIEFKNEDKLIAEKVYKELHVQKDRWYKFW